MPATLQQLPVFGHSIVVAWLESCTVPNRFVRRQLRADLATPAVDDGAATLTSPNAPETIPPKRGCLAGVLNNLGPGMPAGYASVHHPLDSIFESSHSRSPKHKVKRRHRIAFSAHPEHDQAE